MNKQEALKKIEKLNGLTIKEKNLILDIEMISKGDVLEIIEQIDESQKVVVPQFVADWLEVCKENLGFGLSNAMSHSTSAMNKQPNWVKRWFNFKDNQETFAKAWLFGYEVEKEKLYKVLLKRSGLGVGIQQQDDSFKEKFTKTELNKFGFNDLDVYEIKELED
ncbi:hypothetical protein Si079_01009 [Streptococcus infantarius subsp. infantarius]|nr:hypothetical protein [Streptococcus infantarius subsp. infantarius]